MKQLESSYDFIVVGGGVAGICAALAAARRGLKTALVHDRPVLGGNASSEVKISIDGAARVKQGFKNAHESGIVLEIKMRNKKANPQYSFNVQDNIFKEMVDENENLDLYLNTSMQEAIVEDDRIKTIIAYQTSTRKTFTLHGDLFCDTTGDANLAYSAGADYTIGREARSTYNESIAPEVADHHTMGSTILYTARDYGKPMKYTRPKWAYEIKKEDLKFRGIHELTNGYWWVEVGGDDLSVIEDAEEIRDELLKYAFGTFDYIKNSGDFPEAENLAIDWVCAVPGKRESRRIIGDHVLNQNDIDNVTTFEDTVAYGGWSMDDHTVGGIRAMGTGDEDEGSIWHAVKDVYTIPHRSIYSRNIKNLYAGGRCVSASHMAMSSTRVISTCAVIGQAIGTSAVLAKKYNVDPRGVGEHIKELQQTLLRDDCYLPRIKNEDPDDLIRALKPSITASSYIKGGEPELVNNDFARRIEDEENKWISQPMSEDGEWISASFKQSTKIKTVLLRFDPNFSKYISCRITDQDRNYEEMQNELVRDFKVEFINDGKVLSEVLVEDNFVRMNEISLDNAVECDQIKVTVLKTYGNESARINDFRIYAE